MTVFVDNADIPYRGMLMSHLWADTREELLAMVDTIGVQRKWLQEPPKASWLHFDIARSKKALAIKAGAILTDRYGPVEHTANLKIKTLKLQLEKGDINEMDYYTKVSHQEKMLSNIKIIRERHQ